MYSWLSSLIVQDFMAGTMSPCGLQIIRDPSGTNTYLAPFIGILQQKRAVASSQTYRAYSGVHVS